MAAMVTFYPRRALLEATAAGRSFQIPVQSDDTRVATWEHRFEIRSGKYTLWEHSFEIRSGRYNRAPTGTATITAAPATAQTVYDYPGAYAQRFDGDDKVRSDAAHVHGGASLFLGPPDRGVYLHGWPACNLQSCIVLLRQFEDLRQAISAEKLLRFSIGG